MRVFKSLEEIHKSLGYSFDNAVIFCAQEEELLPEFGNYDDAGFDLKSAFDFSIRMGETKLISTGVKLFISPFLGIHAEIRPRSGLALEGFTIVNSPGTVDPSYRGEIKIVFHYLYDCLYNDVKVKTNFSKGERIAQLVLVPYFKFSLPRLILNVEIRYLLNADEFNNWEKILKSVRGNKGFGSSGR